MSSRDRTGGGRGGFPSRLGDLLPGALERIGPAGVWKEAQVRRVWPRVAGEALAAHTRVGRLRGTSLEVWVPSEVWATELRYLGSTITARLNEVVGKGVVEEVIVRREGRRAL